jgi:hypothetical protein
MVELPVNNQAPSGGKDMESCLRKPLISVSNPTGVFPVIYRTADSGWENASSFKLTIKNKLTTTDLYLNFIADCCFALGKLLLIDVDTKMVFSFMEL